MAAALQAGSIDTMDQFSVAISPQLLNGSFNVISHQGSHPPGAVDAQRHGARSRTSSSARRLPSRLDRPAIVTALFKGYAQVGNDSPFAPVFHATNTSVPQRKQDLAQAKKLLAQAGVPNGFSTPLLTETTQEIPHFAQIVKQSAAKIGVEHQPHDRDPDEVLRQRASSGSRTGWTAR